MELRAYLIETFRFNDSPTKMLNKIRQLSDKAESIRLFSH